LKILRVAADLYPSSVGGLGIHIDEMSRGQAALGHDVTVYTTNLDNSPEEEFVSGYHVRRFKPIIELFGNALSPSMFPALMKNKNHFDVMHAHSHLFFTTNLCSILETLNHSVPFVVTSHGLIPASGPDWLHNIYIPTVGKFVLNSADRVLCYTEEEKARLKKEAGVRSKISVVHNGINTNLFHPIKNKKQTNRLLWIGRFTRGKGIDYLIDAFGVLSQKYPKLHLLLIGDGPEKSNILDKISKLGIDNRVIIRDFCPNSRLCEVYNSSDMFILPSFEEGVPRTIMEAMACGVPIICTGLSHLLEMIKDVGIAIPAKDSCAIVDAVSEIYSNPKLAEQFGINGRNKAVEKYSWNDTVLKTTNMYEELI
jgi:glycosyltransferase involved in cell wall biosynthesis